MRNHVNFVLLAASIISLSACSLALEKPKTAVLASPTKAAVVIPPQFTNEIASTQIDRYETVKNAATSAQTNPMLAISEFKFHSQVKTTGDAITHILLNSGYHLSPKSALTADVLTVLSQPLPITQRELGPITLIDAIKTIVGKDVYDIEVDPIHRLLTLKLNPKYRKFVDTTTE